jgi:flagellar M-ring protein FliF
MAIVIKFLKDLGPIKLLAAGMALFFLLLLTGVLIYNATKPNMIVLYSGLDTQDSNKVIQELEAKKLNFQVLADGAIIKVPESQLLKARVVLAQAALPSKGSIVGYEIFDKDEALGTTNFQQNVKMLRALEGELSRTILAFKSVNKVRVHLVMPQKELFSKERQEPRASIVIDPKGSETLSKNEVDAIAHLVATSVPDLNFKDVTIVDTKGKSLKVGSKDSDGYDASDQNEYKNLYVAKLQSSLEELLERSLGYGKVKVLASADINFDKVVINSETFDADNPVLRSTQVIEEREKSPLASEDNIDISVLNNLPGGDSSLNENNAAVSEKTDETKNYEISKIVKNQILQSGIIQKLSVAVMIDGNYALNPETNKMEYKPRDEEELARIEKLVKVAIGYNEERNDRVEVISMPFVNYFEEPKVSNYTWLEENMVSILKTCIVALSSLLVAIFVIRPIFIKLIEIRRLDEADKLSKEKVDSAEKALEALKDTVNHAEVKAKFKNVQETAKTYPEESLMVLRQWLNKG